jgi:hypothetical protein
MVSRAAISGYVTESVHLPYLLDPMHERYGPKARLWLSEVVEPRFGDGVRVASNVWTTLDEWSRPAWVGGTADMRVRLRFALLAAASACAGREAGARIRTLSLRDIPMAAVAVERICAGARRADSLPQAVSLAGMAVRSAAAQLAGAPPLMDLVTREYPVYAWYAAMTAACACTGMEEIADEAVRCEYRSAVEPAWADALEAVR